jgi:hypothetical protein
MPAVPRLVLRPSFASFPWCSNCSPHSSVLPLCDCLTQAWWRATDGHDRRLAIGRQDAIRGPSPFNQSNLNTKGTKVAKADKGRGEH